MYQLNDIKIIHMEVTQNCQAACPMCDRNMNGAGINPHINLDELTLSDIKQIFSPKFISQLSAMYMCGNLGDPIIAKDSLEIFEYFRSNSKNIWLGMNTNGGARNSEWWAKLANIFGSKGAVIFSIDGLEDTNHIYRQNVIWDKIIQNANSFILNGGRARWDFLVFEHNQHQVDEAKILSEKMGFEKFIVKKTGRFITASSELKNEHIVKNKKQETVIKKPKEEYVNSALLSQKDIIKKYSSMDDYYDKTNIKCKVKDEGNLFITAEGLILPCCWTAGRMYKWWQKDYRAEQIWNFIDKIGGKEKLNAKTNTLDDIFNSGFFELIEKSWDKPSCKDGKLKVCSMKCGIELDLFKGQFI